MSTEFAQRASTWSGWVIFAGVVLFTIGCLNVIQGIAALARSGETYAVPEANLLVATDYTAWGWSLIIWGAIMILAGLGLFSGNEFARWAAIIIVVVNLIGQFSFFPAFPLWSLVVIGLDLAVLFALTARWEYAKAALTQS
ncbi:MAG: hypothetical protein OEM67_12125 [Thermoleophilia bacterium]|nr:hypothetical protein [Thermoleophilia bacterium]MDH3725785.1 hypothetical protein [Thermoleophilia bacterium]